VLHVQHTYTFVVSALYLVTWQSGTLGADATLANAGMPDVKEFRKENAAQLALARAARRSAQQKTAAGEEGSCSARLLQGFCTFAQTAKVQQRWRTSSLVMWQAAAQAAVA
jgi:hypothetical protein